MNLAALVARLGFAEVAKRAGVSTSTLKLWVRQGPSARGAARISVITRRHVAGLKAAATRKKRVGFPGSLPLPPEPFRGFDKQRWLANDDPNPNYGSGIESSGTLQPDEILPTRAPVETRKDFERARRREGYTGAKRINTDEYVGESEWVTIGQPMLEVDVERLASGAIERWRYSRRNWCQVRFMIFRFIPFNPLYKGEMLRKQGNWVDWWTSTRTFGDEGSLRDGIEVGLSRGIQAASSRVIWLEAMNVRTFDNKEDLPTTRRLMRRTLR